MALENKSANGKKHVFRKKGHEIFFIFQYYLKNKYCADIAVTIPKDTHSF